MSSEQDLTDGGRGAGRGLPRWFEAPVAFVGLLVLSPVLVMCAVAVKLSSSGPVLFRQERIGRFGTPFELLKFRTMRPHQSGPQVTAAGDSRITGVGRWLRRLKLDELPQLWNVVIGVMSIVGPRPEVRRYVDMDSALWQAVLVARPGITDPMTLQLRNEEAVLSAVEGDRESYYREVMLPVKLQGYHAYLQRRTWWSDLGVIVTTMVVILGLKATLDDLFSHGGQPRVGDS